MSAESAKAHVGHIRLLGISCSTASFREEIGDGPLGPRGAPPDPEFSIAMRVREWPDEGRVRVELRVVIKPDAMAGQPYEVDVAYGGDFAIGELPKGLTPKSFAERNAPAILFPYVREAVTSLTSRGSAGPLFLPPVNLAALFDKGRKKTS